MSRGREGPSRGLGMLKQTKWRLSRIFPDFKSASLKQERALKVADALQYGMPTFKALSCFGMLQLNSEKIRARRHLVSLSIPNPRDGPSRPLDMRTSLHF